MPVFREEHLLTCPIWLLSILAREARAYRELLPLYQAASTSATIHENVCKKRRAKTAGHAPSPASSEGTTNG